MDLVYAGVVGRSAEFRAIVLSALCGQGFDESSLRRALELEDPDFDVPVPFRAHSTAAQVLSWAGRLDEASEHVQVLRRRCMERGADTDMLFVDVWASAPGRNSAG